MSRPLYKLIERPDELLIGVRFLRPILAAIMLTVLGLLSAMMVDLHKPLPFLILVLVVDCFALFVAFSASWVSVKPGLLKIYSAPVGSRRTMDPAEIEDIFCSMTRTVTGRGVIERYSLKANVRNSRIPVTLLSGFEREGDADSAAEVLTSRLNSFRPATAVHVFVRS